LDDINSANIIIKLVADLRGLEPPTFSRSMDTSELPLHCWEKRIKKRRKRRERR